MPTFDITRTALSALIFFCFLLVKERPLEINYDFKLVNLVTCIFFPHKLPQPPSEALHNPNEKRGTESRNCKYPASSVFRGSEALGELPTAEALCHIAQMDAWSRLLCLPVVLCSWHSRDR